MEQAGTHTVCRPVGELDAATVGQFREELAPYSGQARLVIDLSEVPFMDSAGLGGLIGSIRRAREQDGEVAIVCGGVAITRLLHTTGLDRIVAGADSIEDALDALGPPPR